jgi:L-alanine-DL-glutamate epimerase-like enolase superfamily enzyme
MTRSRERDSDLARDTMDASGRPATAVPASAFFDRTMLAMHTLKISSVSARAFTIPTESQLADGAGNSSATTIIVVNLRAGNVDGLGYTYGDAAAASVVNRVLAPVLEGGNAMDTAAQFRVMQGALRATGRSGIASAALSAVDIALWDAKAKALKTPLAMLLGRAREAAPIYGCAGYTICDDRVLAKQMALLVRRDGCTAVKMKVGAQPERDPARVGIARAAIGDGVALMVDASGAYTVKQAICHARIFGSEYHVRWFEDPVHPDDLDGMRRLRDHVPAPMEVAAGDYACDVDAARRLLEAGAVDVLQANATRCGGVTGFMRIAALCEAFHVDLSTHCAPSVHAHLGAAAGNLRHCEWPQEQVRIEQLLFDGAPVARGGLVALDGGRPGLGLVLKRQDVGRYAAAEAA